MGVIAYIKGRADWIAPFLVGALGGCGIGSFFDRFLIAMEKVSFRHPYRVPFDRFFTYLGLVAAVLLFLGYVAFTATRKDISLRGKVIRFLVVALIAFVVAIGLAVLWMYMLNLVHDFKRIFGLSRP